MREIDGIEEAIEILRPHWAAIEEDFNRENERFKALLAREHDTLGRVLKCHLIVEHYVGRFLAAHFNLNNIGSAKLSFFQKATLLPDAAASAAFVKPGILRLNTIRNQFGHTLEPVVGHADLGAMQTVLDVARPGVAFPSPIEAIEAFTTVACTWLILPPPALQQVFVDAFAGVRVHAI